MGKFQVEAGTVPKRARHEKGRGREVGICREDESWRKGRERLIHNIHIMTVEAMIVNGRKK